MSLLQNILKEQLILLSLGLAAFPLLAAAILIMVSKLRRKAVRRARIRQARREAQRVAAEERRAIAAAAAAAVPKTAKAAPPASAPANAASQVPQSQPTAAPVNTGTGSPQGSPAVPAAVASPSPAPQQAAAPDAAPPQEQSSSETQPEGESAMQDILSSVFVDDENSTRLKVLLERFDETVDMLQLADMSRQLTQQFHHGSVTDPQEEAHHEITSK